MTMIVEYADESGQFGFHTQIVGTASESFNVFTTETFPLAGVTTDRVRASWFQSGFILNFPWEVRVDTVTLE